MISWLKEIQTAGVIGVRGSRDITSLIAGWWRSDSTPVGLGPGQKICTLKWKKWSFVNVILTGSVL